MINSHQVHSTLRTSAMRISTVSLQMCRQLILMISSGSYHKIQRSSALDLSLAHHASILVQNLQTWRSISAVSRALTVRLAWPHALCCVAGGHSLFNSRLLTFKLHLLNFVEVFNFFLTFVG